MKKILGVIVAIIIFWIAGIISSILKIMVEQSRADMIDISEFQFVAMGLIPFIPFLIAIWLIKLSWRKITYEEPKEINTASKKVDTSLPKAVINHSKDIASYIKPTINKYKEKHSFSNTTIKEKTSSIPNNLDINEDEIYEQVMIEIEEDNKVKSTWAKALAQSNGVKDKAVAIYIKERVTNIKKEKRIKEELENSREFTCTDKESPYFIDEMLLEKLIKKDYKYAYLKEYLVDDKLPLKDKEEKVKILKYINYR